jgi:hypothetical protein
MDSSVPVGTGEALSDATGPAGGVSERTRGVRVFGRVIHRLAAPVGKRAVPAEPSGSVDESGVSPT